jgi:hypothetical protein
MKGAIVKGFVFAILAIVIAAGSAYGFTCSVVYPTTVWQYDQDSSFTIEIWVNSADVQINGGSLGFAVNRKFVRIDSVALGPEITGVYPQEIYGNNQVFPSNDDTLTYCLFGQLSLGSAIFPQNTDVLFGTCYMTYLYDSLLTIQTAEQYFILDSSFIPPAGDFVLTNSGGSSDFCTDYTNPGVTLKFSKVTDINPGVLPGKFELAQNFPNPFNPDTKIEFAVPQKSQVDLVIYNVMGQKVRTLVSDELDAGWKQVTWDGKDDSGNTVSSGIYLYKLNAGEFVDSKKMTLVK